MFTNLTSNNHHDFFTKCVQAPTCECPWATA